MSSLFPQRRHHPAGASARVGPATRLVVRLMPAAVAADQSAAARAAFPVTSSPASGAQAALVDLFSIVHVVACYFVHLAVAVSLAA